MRGGEKVFFCQKYFEIEKLFFKKIWEKRKFSLLTPQAKFKVKKISSFAMMPKMRVETFVRFLFLGYFIYTLLTGIHWAGVTSLISDFGYSFS